MMLNTSRPIIVVLALLTALAVPPVRDASSRCSKAIRLFGVKERGEVYVLGAARSDTVVAGGDGVSYYRLPGDSGRPIYGQLFSAQRVGGPASSPFPRGSAAVVIVPWNYGASCEPLRWTESARWLPPGERALVIGAARDRRYWINGVPTIDVHTPASQPYPQRWLRLVTDTLMSAADGFDLLEAMPDRDTFERSTSVALEPLHRWISANPVLARSWPVQGSIRVVENEVEHTLVRAIVPPIAGTWRFTLARPGRDSAVFFVRTDARPARVWNYQRTDSGVPLTRVRTPDDYYLHAATAMSERELPTGGGDWTMHREGYLGLVREPRQRADGSRAWKGRVQLEFIENELFPNYDIGNRPADRDAQGTFVMDAQGRVRAELTIGRWRGRAVVFRGERISTVTLHRD